MENDLKIWWWLFGSQTIIDYMIGWRIALFIDWSNGLLEERIVECVTVVLTDLFYLACASFE